MFLTLPLCLKQFGFKHFGIKRLKIKGHLFRGKYRLVRKVTPLDVAALRRDLEIERRNMFYLRNPYLKAKEWDSTPEEEKKIVPIKTLEKYRQERIKHFQRYQESRTLDYFLNNTLGNAEKWE